MTRYLLGALLAVLLAYGLFEAWPLIRGPVLTVESPPENATVPGGIVTLRGRAARASLLTVNGGLVLHDAHGDFAATMTFPRGGSILTFVAKDRFGRSTTVTRQIFVP